MYVGKVFDANHHLGGNVKTASKIIFSHVCTSVELVMFDERRLNKCNGCHFRCFFPFYTHTHTHKEKKITLPHCMLQERREPYSSCPSQTIPHRIKFGEWSSWTVDTIVHLSVGRKKTVHTA
jgi:hypothetical protein